MAYSLTEINTGLRTDPKGFIETCDAAYRQRVTHAADVILARMADSPIVLLSGPSGSGKTTTALKLEEELERRGVSTHTISMDNYFLTMDHRTAPRTPEGDIDYESPRMMDMDLLDESFTKLARGEEIIVPKFEFARQMRNTSRGVPLTLGKNEIAIFEGIHALNDDVAGRHPEATTLYISARSDVVDDAGRTAFKGTWMRIARRAVRDYNFRGTEVHRTLAMWHNVRRGEKAYISPFKGRAKVVIDSSHPYEVNVLANYAPVLRSALDGVAPGNPRYRELHDLVDAFAGFPAVSESLISADSLIREFIGGGSYHYS